MSDQNLKSETKKTSERQEKEIRAAYIWRKRKK